MGLIVFIINPELVAFILRQILKKHQKIDKNYTFAVDKYFTLSQNNVHPHQRTN